MIRRHRYLGKEKPNRRSLLLFRAVQVLDFSRLTSGLTLLGLASLFAMSSPASAQIAVDGASNRIEFAALSEDEAHAALEQDAAANIYDEPGTFTIWEHGASQCCGDCAPAWRVRAEATLFKYASNSDLTLSNNFSLGAFDFEEGGRVSLIRHLDCLDAWELAYAGPYEWNEFGQVNGVGLTSRLASATVNLSEFNNATFHSQSYRTKLNSGELNRRWYGWDVISTMAGIRYIKLDEDYDFNSTGAGGAGLLSIDTRNDMFGPQLGIDLMYPLGNWMTTTTFKGALMASRTEADVLLTNAGTVEVANSDERYEFGSLLEMGYYFSYQLTRRIKLRGGYEFWWLHGFASVPEQITNPITTQTGTHVDGRNGVFFHGATAGVEIVW